MSSTTSDAITLDKMPCPYERTEIHTGVSATGSARPCTRRRGRTPRAPHLLEFGVQVGQPRPSADGEQQVAAGRESAQRTGATEIAEDLPDVGLVGGRL